MSIRGLCLFGLGQADRPGYRHHLVVEAVSNGLTFDRSEFWLRYQLVVLHTRREDETADGRVSPYEAEAIYVL